MKRLEEEKKVSLMDRMKKLAEETGNRAESQFEDEDDMRVIEDEENAVVEPMDECSPEEYIKVHMANRKMVEIYDEVNGEWVKVPVFETGVDDNVKSEEEIIAEANNRKLTTGIIIGIIVFIALVFWFCFTLII